MIWAALRQAAKTYAVGACLLRLVQLVDEALDSPAPASPPEPPAPAGSVIDGELADGERAICACGHPRSEHLGMGCALCRADPELANYCLNFTAPGGGIGCASKSHPHYLDGTCFLGTDG